MILRLSRWRGDREQDDFFETCWQDLNLRLTHFSWVASILVCQHSSTVSCARVLTVTKYDLDHTD